MKLFARNLVRRKRVSFDIGCLINPTVAQSCLSGHEVAAASLVSRNPWVSEDLRACGGYVPALTWHRHRARTGASPAAVQPLALPSLRQRPGPAAGRRGGSPGPPVGQPRPGPRGSRRPPAAASFPPRLHRGARGRLGEAKSAARCRRGGGEPARLFPAPPRAYEREEEGASRSPAQPLGRRPHHGSPAPRRRAAGSAPGL